jgi:hypothetical protein
MSQRLEQFVRDHREEFDSEEPGKKLWDKICLDLEPPKKEEKKSIVIRLTRTTLSVAAAVLLIIVAGIWYLETHRTTGNGTDSGVAKADPVKPQITGSESTQQIPADTNTKETPATNTPVTTAPEKEQLAKTTAPKNEPSVKNDQESIIGEEMIHYARLVELKHKELRIIEKDEPLLYKQFASDVNKLDSVFHGLQQQLPKNPNKEQLLEAMLQNLQLQMGLLNHQLDIIKQINHSKKTVYEKAYKTA